MVKGLSLFANVGIGELLLKEVGVDIVVANELLKERAKFYRENHPESEMIEGDITDKKVFKQVIESAKKAKVEFIIATPPCQGFSIAGKQDENDPRNNLIIKVIESIELLNPKYVVIENVPQMLKSYISYKGKNIKILDLIEKKLGNKYNFKSEVLDAADYGTPQYRKRAFILMTAKSLKQEWEFPKKQKHITVREVIGDLPSLEAGENSNIKYHNAKTHNDRHILWMKHTPTGKTAFENKVHFPKKDDGQRISGFSTTYKRIDWDRPSPTITMANGSVSSQNNVHPGRLKKDGTYSDARVLTIKEIILLSGIPDSWIIPAWASENLTRHVLGEMVPPKMIQALVKMLKLK